MKRLILASLVLALSACVTTPRFDPAVVAAADARLTQVETGYFEAKRFVALWLPMLSPEHRARIEAAEATVERALAAAHAAVDVADRVAAAEQASDALDRFRFVSGS